MHSYADMFIRRHTPTHGLMHALAKLKFVYGVHGAANRTNKHTHTQ